MSRLFRSQALRSRMILSSQFLGIMGVLLLTASVGWADTLVAESSSSALAPDSSIGWSQLGGDQTKIPASFSATSNKGLGVTGTLAASTSVVSVVCAAAPPNSSNCSWNGAGFTAGDSLLWTTNANGGGNGPLTITFATGVVGAGALVQADVPGAFTVSMEAFNGSTSLGSVTTGSDAAGDASTLVLKTQRAVTSPPSLTV